MILNIVKNGTDSSSILECVRKTFNNSKVSIKTDYEISVDIEVVGEDGYTLIYNSTIGGVYMLYREANDAEIEWYNNN